MVDTILVGSEALRLVGYEVGRKRLDADYIVKPDRVATFLVETKARDIKVVDESHIYGTLPDGRKIELEVAWPDSCAAELFDSPWIYPDGVATPELCYMLKMSHRFKKNSTHFAKTMADIKLLRRALFVSAEIPILNAKQKKWLKKREKETYNYKHPRLSNVTKKEFFNDDGIDYRFDHDSIHEAIKRLWQPAYNYFKDDTQEVATSRELFESCDREIQLTAVLEEAYVLSLERCIIPYDVKEPARRRWAFDYALEKVCTSITSGWFRDFAWENYQEVKDMYDPEYVERFFNAVERGEVKPYERSY
jgi:hypothetical protein